MIQTTSDACALIVSRDGVVEWMASSESWPLFLDLCGHLLPLSRDDVHDGDRRRRTAHSQRLFVTSEGRSRAHSSPLHCRGLAEGVAVLYRCINTSTHTLFVQRMSSSLDTRPQGAPFGAVIAARRAALRLSLRSLSARAGIDPAQISRMERGILPPPQHDEIIDRLASALGIEGSDRILLGDLAALENGRIPRDLVERELVQRVLPLLASGLRRFAERDSQSSGLTAAGFGVLSETELASDLAKALTEVAAAPSPSVIADAVAVVRGDLTLRRPSDLPPLGLSRQTESAARTRRLTKDAALLQRCFAREMAQHPALAALVKGVRGANATGVVFGGWARDWVAAATLKRDIPTNDIDMVIDGMSDTALHALLEQVAPGAVSRNSFGGFAVHAGALKMDLWLLASTYTFVRRGERASFDALPRTTVFTVESIVFKPRQWWGKPAVVEDGLYASLDTRTIDLQVGERAFPEFQAGRALQYAEKLGLELSPRVLDFLSKTLGNSTAFALAKKGVRQYGSPRYRRGVLRDLHELRVALGRVPARRAEEAAARPTTARRLSSPE